MFKLSDFQISQHQEQDFAMLNSSSLNLLNVNKPWLETKGEGIKIAIIDTGVDIDHRDLAGRITKTFNACDGSADVNDTFGHGTHVAGIIAGNGIIKGVAPGAEVFVIKAFQGENATIDAIARGIRWSIENKADVISMSLGAQSSSLLLEQAVNDATKAGIICVCAAGNDNIGSAAPSLDYPASFANALAVGAVDTAHHIASFSSTGDVDVVAHGVDVASTYLDGSYCVMSGTSMATPIISGAVALYQSMALKRLGRKLSFEEIKLSLAMNSEDLGSLGKDDFYGYGMFSF